MGINAHWEGRKARPQCFHLSMLSSYNSVQWCRCVAGRFRSDSHLAYILPACSQSTGTSPGRRVRYREKRAIALRPQSKRQRAWPPQSGSPDEDKGAPEGGGADDPGPCYQNPRPCGNPAEPRRKPCGNLATIWQKPGGNPGATSRETAAGAHTLGLRRRGGNLAGNALGLSRTPAAGEPWWPGTAK